MTTTEKMIYMKTRNFLFTSLLALASTVTANAQTFYIYIG